MVLTKDCHTPRMVLVVDEYNNSHYENYTGDLSLETYTVNGESYGKHLFKSLKIHGKSFDELYDKSPKGTIFMEHSLTRDFLVTIEYYVHPKSVVGAVIFDSEERRLNFLRRLHDSSREIGELRRNIEHIKKINSLSGVEDSESKYKEKRSDLVKSLRKERESLANTREQVECLKSKLNEYRKKECESFAKRNFGYMVLTVILSTLFYLFN